MSNLLEINQKLKGALFNKLTSQDSLYRLVIDDKLITVNGSTVYLAADGQNAQRTGVVAVILKDKNRDIVTNKIQPLFDNLSNTMYTYNGCTGDFRYYSNEYDPMDPNIPRMQEYSLDIGLFEGFDVNDIKVQFDANLHIVYINSALDLKLKQLVKVDVNAVNYSAELMPMLYAYTTESVHKYAQLTDVVFKNVLNGSMRTYRYLTYVNSVFRSTGHQKHAVGFIQLFHSCSTLYNPFYSNRFLADKVLGLCKTLESEGKMFNVEAKKPNSTMEPITIKCITPLELCKAFNLPYKVGFSTTSALLLIAGLILPATGGLPTPYFGTYLDGIAGEQYTVPPHNNGFIKPCTTLVAYTERFKDILGEGEPIDIVHIYNTLSVAFGGQYV